MGGETVVVTGAAGFLGHHVLKLLIALDDAVDEIRCLDTREPNDLMVKIVEEQQKKLREKLGRAKRVKWIKGDIRDVNVVEQVLNRADCVIHLAAKIDVWTDKCEQNVTELESINVEGTENLLRAAVRLGVHKFIHVSSIEAFLGFDTIYYATENTVPEAKWFLFGASGSTKRDAENKVKQYSNNKLYRQANNGNDSLNAIIVRFPAIYGEFDQHYVSKILEVTKFFGGKLRRLDNIWIRQQPIYVENAAWSLIKAKNCMERDQSISGEEFHITDETPIGDPFDFVEPYVLCKGMRVTTRSYPFLPLWLLLVLFFAMKRLVEGLDFFGLFTEKRNRLQEAIERDEAKSRNSPGLLNLLQGNVKQKRWFHYVTPQTLGFMCISCFLNRTKASLRLDYEPLVGPDEAKQKSLIWYKRDLVI